MFPFLVPLLILVPLLFSVVVVAVDAPPSSPSSLSFDTGSAGSAGSARRARGLCLWVGFRDGEGREGCHV